MSTFERVKRNILRDMAGSKVHTAASWANIMLNNTAALTDVTEQRKFWGWMQNPTDDERPDPLCELFEKHTMEDIPKYVKVTTDADDEKSTTVELEQECHRNGAAMFINVKPRVVNYEEKVDV
jgi:hypothetical protein